MGSDSGGKNKGNKGKSLGSKYSDPKRKSWAKKNKVGMYGGDRNPMGGRNYDPQKADRAFASDTGAGGAGGAGGGAGGGSQQVGQKQAPQKLDQGQRLAASLSVPVHKQIRQIKKQLGPGEYDDGQFQPDRGFGGTFRDTVFGYERGVSPELAAKAATKGTLGELSYGLREGVLQTEEKGKQLSTDPFGQLISAADVATSMFQLPSPSMFKTPVGAAMGTVPVLGAGRAIAQVVEESQAVGKLRDVGMLPKMQQRAATSPLGRSVAGGGSAVAAAVDAGPSAVEPVAPTEAAAPRTQGETFDEFLRRRAARAGFRSTIRTGAYGVTQPLAVRT